MTFTDLVAGDSVFLDANSFIYHFSPDPVLGPPCSQLLQRIENQELSGFTAVHLLAEVAHKLMTIEAALGLRQMGQGERAEAHRPPWSRLWSVAGAVHPGLDGYNV